jgi:UDP-glucose 4-epimerase
MTVLITGGAGYIGSHANKLLNENKYQTIVIDNLENGHLEAVKWGKFIHGDLVNIETLRGVFQNHSIQAVLHFAAYAYVSESVSNPEKYYLNNLSSTLNLLKVMREFHCNRIVFSSSCATYGDPQYLPIDEAHPQNPINPYGQSKLMIEKILKDYSEVHELHYVSLRYFNAAGADLEGEIGEYHDPETHLIPLILNAAIGKREEIKVFGTDFDTPDGSAIRDYVHVSDLAKAHLLALEYLEQGGKSDCFNLGNAQGYSVFEVIERAKKITGRDFKVTETERRKGDPPILIGKSEKAGHLLGWQPKYSGLDIMLNSAWDWHQKKANVIGHHEQKKETPMILDLGCGNAKVMGAVGVDQILLPGVDIVHDLLDFPYPLEDASVDEIYLNHVITHFPFVDIRKILSEAYRLLKPGHVLYIRVPHVYSVAAWADPTQRMAFAFTSGSFLDHSTDKAYHIKLDSRWELVSTASRVTLFNWKRYRMRKVDAWISNIFARLLNWLLKQPNFPGSADILVKMLPVFFVEIEWQLRKLER